MIPLMPPAVDVTTAGFIAGRALAAVRARHGGWFWLPCPLCGTEFGGHEMAFGPRSGPYPSHIPDPARPPQFTGSGWTAGYQGICPFCVAARRGWDWPEPAWLISPAADAGEMSA